MKIDEQMTTALSRFDDNELRAELERRKTVQADLELKLRKNTLFQLGTICSELEGLMDNDAMTCETNRKSTGLEQWEVFKMLRESVGELDYWHAEDFEFSLTLEVRRVSKD